MYDELQDFNKNQTNFNIFSHAVVNSASSIINVD